MIKVFITWKLSILNMIPKRNTKIKSFNKFVISKVISKGESLEGMDKTYQIVKFILRQNQKILVILHLDG
jgi:hypothetical protein